MRQEVWRESFTSAISRGRSASKRLAPHLPPNLIVFNFQTPYYCPLPTTHFLNSYATDRVLAQSWRRISERDCASPGAGRSFDRHRRRGGGAARRLLLSQSAAGRAAGRPCEC